MQRVLMWLAGVLSLACAGTGVGLDESGKPFAEGIEVSLDDVALPTAGTVQIDVTTRDEDGNVVTNLPFQWSTTNSAVAQVSPTGLVTAGNPGTATLRASSGSAFDEVLVTVVASAVFGADVQTIFSANCAFPGGCHAGVMPQQGQDLSIGNAYVAIVRVPSMELPSMSRIDPGDPLMSYLVHKIRGTHLDVGGSGVRMPFGGQLAQDEIDIIRAWVQIGAPNN